MFYNFIQSGSKYLITTTFPDVTVNDDLKYSNAEVSGRRLENVINIFHLCCNSFTLIFNLQPYSCLLVLFLNTEISPFLLKLFNS